MLQHLNPNITNTEIEAKLEMDFAIWFKTYVSLLFHPINLIILTCVMQGLFCTLSIKAFFVKAYVSLLFSTYQLNLILLTCVNTYILLFQAEDRNSGIHNNFIQDLAKGPLETVKIYNGYFVSGYKFHTVGHGASKMSINSGVCIKGQNYSHNADDWYGQLREVVEVEYLNWPIKRTVLFMCDWFDPTPNRGIRVHEQYNIVEINHRR